MPNRMLRDWTLSDKINSLSVHAERFFTRLIMQADDYGCFYADHRILKAKLFPLLDGLRDTDISRWMAECHKTGLIVIYEADSKRYLQIVDFRQRLDKAKSKFPLPEDGNEEKRVVNEFPPEVEVEKEIEVEPEGKAVPPKPKEKVFSEKKELIFPYTSEKFMQVWEILIKEKKWRGKSHNALQASLKELSEFDEDYAIGLMNKAISGGYQGVVFSNTKAEYQKSKNGATKFKSGGQQISASNAEKLQRIMEGNL